MNKICKDGEHNYAYFPHVNEEGWKCVECSHAPGEPPGFSPQLDRAMTEHKVASILMDLHTYELVYVSNSDEGARLAALVAERCQRERVFDQLSIVSFLIEAMLSGHQSYWKEISESVLAGHDIRNRCWCGALSKMASNGKHYCGPGHMPESQSLFQE